LSTEGGSTPVKREVQQQGQGLLPLAAQSVDQEELGEACPTIIAAATMGIREDAYPTNGTFFANGLDLEPLNGSTLRIWE